MRENVESKLADIFQRIKIHPEYSPESIQIKDYYWNGSMEDFRVEYYIEDRKCVFHYNEEIAKRVGEDYINIDPLEQLESELKYIDRMYGRGIGAKEYYPFTEI